MVEPLCVFELEMGLKRKPLEPLIDLRKKPKTQQLSDTIQYIKPKKQVQDVPIAQDLFDRAVHSADQFLSQVETISQPEAFSKRKKQTLGQTSNPEHEEQADDTRPCQIKLQRGDMSKLQLIQYDKNVELLNENPDLFEVVVNIIEGKGPHKLAKRVIEHLITNYAKKNNLVLENGFNVYENYKRMLPKSFMDPCCRGPRMPLKYKDRMVETTVQQVNSIVWVASTPILKYAMENYEVIKEDLNEQKKIFTKKSARKRAAASSTLSLSSSSSSGVCKFALKMTDQPVKLEL